MKEVKHSNSMYPPENAEEFSPRFFFSSILIFQKYVRHRISTGRQSRETSKKTSTKNALSDTPLHPSQNDAPVGGESDLDHDASMNISIGDVLRGAEKVNTGPSMSSQASTAVSM